MERRDFLKVIGGALAVPPLATLQAATKAEAMVPPEPEPELPVRDVLEAFNGHAKLTITIDNGSGDTLTVEGYAREVQFHAAADEPLTMSLELLLMRNVRWNDRGTGLRRKR